jgi:outer membrane protein assembly factor BamB
MFQHDPQHTGRSPHVGPTYPGLKWRLQVEGFPGSPAIGPGGTIYLPTGNLEDARGLLYAINPDGSVRWRYEFPTNSSETPPCATMPTITTPAIADDGTIYVHTQDPVGPGISCTLAGSDLYAINADGSTRWVFELNEGFGVFTSDDLSSPAIAPDGTIYVTSRDTGLYAVNPDGTEKWATSPELTSISSSPAIGPDGTVYVTIGDLHAYAPDGGEKWAIPVSGGVPNDRSPAVGPDGTIYACGIDPDACHAIGPAGNPLWSVPVDASAQPTTPALAADGTIYFTGAGLYAVTPDGSQLWHTLFGGEASIDHSPVVGGDGRLYARHDLGGVEIEGGVLHVLDPDGTERSTAIIPILSGSTGELGAAIASDGTLYVPEPSSGVSEYDPTNQFLGAYINDPRDCEAAKEKLKKARKKVKQAKKAVKRADDPGEAKRAQKKLKKAKKKKRKAKQAVQKACGA